MGKSILGKKYSNNEKANLIVCFYLSQDGVTHTDVCPFTFFNSTMCAIFKILKKSFAEFNLNYKFNKNMYIINFTIQ